MANTIKFLTKNGLKTQNIDFSSPTEVNTIQVRMLDGGVLSFSGTSGQLFSISDSLTGTIFAVNDISGVPSIEVDDTGVIRFAQYSGNVLFGTAVDNGVDKVQVNGTVSAVSYSSTVATGTAPFTVASTTKVTNLYADKAALADNSNLVGGYAPNAAVSNNTVVLRNATGYIFGNYFNMTANVSATAASHIAIQNSSDNYLRWQTPAQFIANHGLAALLSPALTGVPTAPTAAVNTNTTQLATTAFVNAEIANDAPTKLGSGASGTWPIGITGNAATATTAGTTTGNAATATKLATARAINGVNFDGSAPITIYDATKAPLTGTGTSGTWPISVTGNAATVPWTGVADVPPLAAPISYTQVTGTTALAESGVEYGFVNAGVTTMTLPAAPYVGDIVMWLALNGRLDNVATPNGSLVGGVSENVTLNAKGGLFRFVGGATGWVGRV